MPSPLLAHTAAAPQDMATPPRNHLGLALFWMHFSNANCTY